MARTKKITEAEVQQLEQVENMQAVEAVETVEVSEASVPEVPIDSDIMRSFQTMTPEERQRLMRMYKKQMRKRIPHRTEMSGADRKAARKKSRTARASRKKNR